MQSDKNRKSIFIQREQVHNTMNLSFSILAFLLMFIVLLLSSIEREWLLIAYSCLFTAFLLIRIVINIKVMISFGKLTKKIAPENADFYIAKSWTRKRVGTLWVGIMYIFTLFLFYALTPLLGMWFDIGTDVLVYIILSIHLFLVIILMYVNMQMLDNNIKVAEKRINLKTIEWIQIKADQSNYYKQLFIWYVHIALILPLILMLIPPYRNMWNKLIKN